MATCERISEAFLLPVLEEMLLSFPFNVLGFHSDNGSEYINRQVAELLNKLLIEEQTKSRSRHSAGSLRRPQVRRAVVSVGSAGGWTGGRGAVENWRYWVAMDYTP